MKRGDQDIYLVDAVEQAFLVVSSSAAKCRRQGLGDLCRLMFDANPIVRSDALIAVGALGAVRLWRATVAVLLSDKVWHVRAEAADALASLGVKASVFALTRVASEDENACVRWRSAAAKASIVGSDALPWLRLISAEESDMMAKRGLGWAFLEAGSTEYFDVMIQLSKKGPEWLVFDLADSLLRHVKENERLTYVEKTTLIGALLADAAFATNPRSTAALAKCQAVLNSATLPSTPSLPVGEG